MRAEHPDQAWFWTRAWQAKEREADLGKEGHITRFEGDEEFLRSFDDMCASELDALGKAKEHQMARQDQDDPVFTRPEEYGIENLEAPGEPDRAHQEPSTPVPGVGRESGKEHRREHDLRGATPPDRNIRDRDEREERQEHREALEEEREALDDQRE